MMKDCTGRSTNLLEPTIPVIAKEVVWVLQKKLFAVCSSQTLNQYEHVYLTLPNRIVDITTQSLLHTFIKGTLMYRPQIVGRMISPQLKVINLIHVPFPIYYDIHQIIFDLTHILSNTSHYTLLILSL